MYVKSIEVQGFKSFANRMKFQFHNGITGIVGPNGSGKSNVGDAVRWVLGEQSVKQLRGSNMSDVIFSGTENRKPMGFAMVAITLDNSDHKLPVDYNEVTVTRRLYRSGESEYLINGTACRLRDIKELFYDTGIGKEGYSIIGQGQIDKILSGKPEDRRELFDEAAGIVKFKRRKLAAQKKLDDEHNNLTRITDILSELTRQIGPLQRQSEKARVYLKKREELRQKEINVFVADTGKLTSQLNQVEDKIVISQHDLADVAQKEEVIKAEYSRVEQEIEHLDQVIQEKQELLNQGIYQCQSLESQVTLLQEQIRSAKANDELYEQRIQALDSEIRQKQELIQKEKEKFADSEEELNRARELQEEKEQEYLILGQAIAELDEKIAGGQTDLIDLLNGRSSTKARLQRNETLVEQIQIRKATLVQQILSSKSDEVKLEEIKAGFQKEYDAIGEDIQNIIRKNAALEDNINQIQKKIYTATNELEEQKAQYHRDESRLESLRNMTERYDGYGNSIRRVMERKDYIKGIHGVVADLIKTDKKYESAIETALGGSIQNIVTDNENTAKNMIQFLKQNKYGRATFLPLSAIHAKAGIGNTSALYEPGAIGVASTLVDIDDAYEELIEYLLGKTLIVDHIDHAIAISRKYKQTIRIVTLDGDLLSPGGSMSGGAFKNSSNLLGRRREMDDLTEEIRQKKEAIQSLQQQIEKYRDERTGLRESLVKHTEMMQQEYLKQNTIRLKMEEMESNMKKSLSGRTQIENEMNELDQQLAEIQSNQDIISTELSQSQEKERELESAILGWQKTLEEQKQLHDASTKTVSDLRIETESLRQKKEFQMQTARRIEEEIRRSEQEKQTLKTNAIGGKDDVLEKEAQITSISETIAIAKKEENARKAELEELRNNRKEKNSSQKEFFEKRETLSSLMNELDRERVRLDTQKERLSDYLERQINYMWEEYELTRSQAEEMQTEESEELSVLKKQVLSMKAEIKNLGSVNVNAIEEYKEVSERHEFLSRQHKDLCEGEEALRKIIVELDAGMRKQFQDQFAIIQREFSKAFKELFGGGKGSLELIEDEDILEAGIRIIAQPPGKKLINMMQMSGGEKALTAIALLFAIQNMKPSPFCLLDEIEAALDENNVSRYANYLHKLTKNTQFIIITHRRGTMAVADRLYGITMQEKGVSTQVSVNMVEGELDQ